MDRILALDSNGQAGLALIRSLGSRGLDVTAASHRDPSLGMVSRYSNDSFVHPDPDEDYRAFLDALSAHLEENDYAAVFPLVDKTTALLSKHKADLEATGTAVATEDWDTFTQAYDKATTFSIAEDVDVPAPATYAPESLADVEAIAGELTYPVVVKSRSKSIWGDDGKHHLNRVFPDDYAHSASELLDRYDALVESDDVFDSYPPIVQEYVEGETVTTVVLAHEGDVKAHFQERRLRTHPAAGGNSTLLDGIRDPGMYESARRLVEAMGWTGPAQVEFMRTPDGESRLIEMNGRYWGSLPLAINSGVDFPWLHYQQLSGSAVRRPDTYRTDVIQRRLLYGDVKWLIEQLSERNYAAIGPFARSFVDANHTFFSLGDPRPTALSLLHAAEIGVGALTGSNRTTRDQW